MKLATTTYLSMTLSIIVIIYSILVVRRSRWSWPWLAGGTVLITLYLLSAPPIFDADKQIFPAYERLVTSVNEYRSCDCDVPGDSANIPWTGKLSSNRVGNALLVLAVIALSITIWHQILALRSIASRGPHDEDSQGKASNELRAAKSRFEFHLYFVSAMLVSSVIAVHSYYSWPASILVGDTANALSNLATTIAVVFGAGFTLLIMVVFGPAYFAITQKVRELAESAVGTPSEDESLQSAIETWKKKHDFTMKAHQRVLGILATAGPALVGPTMELLRVVSA